ncbi:PAS domain-containing protein [Muricoccus pecuniae]|uniref:histidine kinase n=1 Tax=Muricoccus pecuniae TaxID=693023 RepID=A0A840YJS7_9PROT|nr:PAS domain-containing protein [Roseomonas pecuniae]MBB5694294.1 PAS domain S-box-containing protein [Roseomonas pecuniae]
MAEAGGAEAGGAEAAGAEAAGLPDLSGSVGALSAAVLGTALDVAGLAVVITDAPLDPPGPVIRYVNAQFEGVTGYPAAELLGRTPRILQGERTDRAELDRLRRELDERRSFIGATMNYRRDGTAYLNEWIVLPVLGPDGAVTHWLSIQRDATRGGGPHPRAEALRESTRALLGTLRAIAARGLASPEEGRAVEDRLAALGRARSLPAGAGIGLETLLLEEIASLGGAGEGTVLEGPPVLLPPGMAEPLALALHELAANAARRGALASPAGRLRVAWAVEGQGAERRLLIDWQERGAPRPEAPGEWQGFGWDVIERTLAFALGGETGIELRPDGLSCRIALPLAPPFAG